MRQLQLLYEYSPNLAVERHLKLAEPVAVLVFVVFLVFVAKV
ncbi:hypothetical protein ACQU0X_27265 [Pseudovibrio ascidiaceicola]